MSMRVIEITLCQDKLIVSDHLRAVRSVRKRAEETEKFATNIEVCLESAFSACTSLGPVERLCFGVFDQFLLDSF